MLTLHAAENDWTCLYKRLTSTKASLNELISVELSSVLTIGRANLYEADFGWFSKANLKGMYNKTKQALTLKALTLKGANSKG